MGGGRDNRVCVCVCVCVCLCMCVCVSVCLSVCKSFSCNFSLSPFISLSPSFLPFFPFSSPSLSALPRPTTAPYVLRIVCDNPPTSHVLRVVLPRTGPGRETIEGSLFSPALLSFLSSAVTTPSSIFCVVTNRLWMRDAQEHQSGL